MKPTEAHLISDKYMVFTAFVSGAIIMVIELLGSRIIGPPFGVSLFVWTSLITVTLVSLALGYWLGGKVADAKNSPALLFTIILSSGIYLLIIPVIKGFVIEHALTLGLRLGSLASSTVLFAPPLFLLGMVAPYIVKLYMTERHEVGATVGWLYSISTFGSFLGTVSTGFLLIPNLSVNNILYLTSFALIAVAAGYWIISRSRYLFVVLALLPLIMLTSADDLPSIVRPDGTKVSVLLKKDSPYGQIKVVDYSYGETHIREFLVDNMIQSMVDGNSKLPLTKYTYYIESLAHVYNREAARALIIGLGGGTIPRRLKEQYSISCDVVEIDPEVVQTAERFFSFKPANHSVHIEDGRYFLRSSKNKYDIIVLDAFSGDTTPSHLLSLEAFELAKKRLADNGVLLINFVGSNRKEESLIPGALHQTLKEVFSSVDVYVSGAYYTASNPIATTFIYVAHDKKSVEMKSTIHPPVHPDFAKDLEGLFERKVSFPTAPFILTDNYNPIDFFDLKVRERLRMHTIQSADRVLVAN